MDDPDIVALIAAIEQFGEGQDLTGLEPRVTDFAVAARGKIGLARQAIAQRIHPEFQQDQLEAATLRNRRLGGRWISLLPRSGYGSISLVHPWPLRSRRNRDRLLPPVATAGQ
jgi:hypothetical protein